MGRVGCICGNILSNSDCPSKDILHVYLVEKVNRMLEADPEITLWDFYTTYDPIYQYWYCDECKRVYLYSYKEPEGGWFGRIEASSVNGIKPDESWKELYVFTDVDIDQTTDLDMGFPLKEYLARKREYRYWYKEQEGLVLAYSGEELAFAYKVEHEITPY